MNFEQIKNNSDSLIELLTAQCDDLETLLSLARAETAAVEQKNFQAVLEIVTERNLILQSLEVFQKQINALREDLIAAEKKSPQKDLASRIVEIANLTLAQDKKTKNLLTESRDEAVEELQKLEKSQRGANAYSPRNGKGLAYDKKA